MKLPWKERLARVRGEERCGWLDRETISSYFEGVALLSGQSYPTWLLERLRAHYAAPPELSLSEMLQYTREQWELDTGWKDTEDQEDAPPYGKGGDLIYELLLEPFYLIWQNQHREE